MSGSCPVRQCLELEPEGGPEDRERWFTEAVAAFAAGQDAAVPVLSPTVRMDADEPMLVLAGSGAPDRSSGPLAMRETRGDCRSGRSPGR